MMSNDVVFYYGDILQRRRRGRQITASKWQRKGKERIATLDDHQCKIQDRNQIIISFSPLTAGLQHV